MACDGLRLALSERNVFCRSDCYAARYGRMESRMNQHLLIPVDGRAARTTRGAAARSASTSASRESRMTSRSAWLKLSLAAAITWAAAGVAWAQAGAPAAAPQPTYLGWRLFQVHCARCHGSDATGTPSAPDLLPRIRGMSEARFVAAVLQRYQWVMPASESAREGAARDALIQDVLRRRAGELVMPAWEGEPSVKAHIDDLFAYLDARASGALGAGMPSQAVR
jgi:mono/diheme cytochrome c family protein